MVLEGVQYSISLAEDQRWCDAHINFFEPQPIFSLPR